MKRLTLTLFGLTGLLIAVPGRASDAETSASAAGGWAGRDGTAAATARYAGDLGWARTQTRSGELNVARGIAVGFDRDGLSLSVSQALAPSYGPALATNFNLSLGRDGSVSGSTGLAVAQGGGERSVIAGGRTAATLLGGSATSVASGRTDVGGRVDALTRAYNHEPQRLSPARPFGGPVRPHWGEVRLPAGPVRPHGGVRIYVGGR